MFIETLKTMRLYKRESKLGLMHTFHRKNVIYVFKCDSCKDIFMRPKSKIDPQRASNDYKHVCNTCDSKKFAQQVGVKMRRVYQLDASSTKTLELFPLDVITRTCDPSLQVSIYATLDVGLIKVPTQERIAF